MSNEDDCSKSCRYARDVGMTEYSCANGCRSKMKDKSESQRDMWPCDHGVTFDEEAAKKAKDEYEIRKRWPRLHGVCPKGCGFNGIAYASHAHYIWGDW